nr:hypothetical protein [Tanacetum cinerariifolium]
MDEGFTTTAYPKTLAWRSFFNDKPSKADIEKTTTKTEADSMVSVTIQQDTSLISPMTTPVIDLTSRPESPNVHQPLKATTTETTITKIHPPPSQSQQSTTDSILMKHIGELEHIMANLIQENKYLEERLDSHEARLYTLENLDIPHHILLYHQQVHLELQDLLELLDPHKCRHHLLHLHPPTKKEERYATPEPVWSIPSSDMPVPKNNWASALASTYSPPLEDSLLAQTGDIAMFMDRFCKRQRINELKPQDLEGPAFNLVKVFRPNVIHLQYQTKECHKLLTDSMDDSILKHNVSKPLPLCGPPGQMKAAYYPDFGLEQMVLIRYGLKRSASMILLLCMVFLTGGSKDNDSTLIDTHLRVIAELLGLISVTFWDRYEVQMIMRFNEIHKFSDITLHQINEALDYRFKEFKVNQMNPSLNTRFWTRKDVDRNKEFMFAIQKWLKIRRIFRNLESFVGGRVRDGDYRLLKRTK